MSRFLAVLVMITSGCYDPAVRDCTVTCDRTGDCAASQVCTTEHYCAASSSISCTNPASATDAPDTIRDPDAPLPDAPPPHPDAPPPPPTVNLHLHADGKGVISIDGTSQRCDAMDTLTHGDCMFAVPLGRPLTLHAAGEANEHFDHWSGACVGQLPDCTLTPLAPADVHATFKKDS